MHAFAQRFKGTGKVLPAFLGLSVEKFFPESSTALKYQKVFPVPG